MRVFATHNKNAEVRKQSSAGGAFTALAEAVLARGGSVYGVAFGPNWRIEHQRIDRSSDLTALRGSKYAFSQPGPSVEAIAADLDAGREVAVCATPCQIAALRKRFGDANGLLLIEVVCHGAPEQRYWTQFLAELSQKYRKTVNDIIDVTFRSKINGWKHYSMVIEFADGRKFVQSYDDNNYMRAFLFGYTVRKACFDCRFKYPDGSNADITLGDFWGITQLAPSIDNDLGTTIVIARTPRGEQAVADLPVDAVVAIEDAARYNPAIIHPSPRPERYEEFGQAAESGLLKAMKKFAGRPLRKQLYLDVARFKYRLLRKLRGK